MRYRPTIVSSVSLLLFACGGETSSNKRQAVGASLDVLASKPVSFEFNLPDRSLIADDPATTARLSAYYYKVQGEGATCPTTEFHEEAGPFEDGKPIRFNVLAACNYLVTVQIGESQAPATALANTVINYDSHIRPIMQSNCVSCHAAYDSYAGVKDAARAIVLAAENETMPPTAPLAGSEIAMLLAWADAGYPEKDPNAGQISQLERTVSKVYYRNNNNDYIASYELLGRTHYELQRSLWLQTAGKEVGFETRQLYTFFGTEL